jgi:hypothetical protein
MPMVAARVVGVAQAAIGAAMLLAPARVAAVAANGGSVAPLPIVRVLGARIAVQGAVTAARPSNTGLELGAAVDALHLTSMIALSALVPRLRRSALASAVLAAGSIAAAAGARR